MATSGVRPHGAGRRELDPGHLVGDPLVVEGGHHPVGAAQHVLRGNGFGRLGAHLGGLRAQRGGLAFGVGALAAAPLFVGGARVEVLLPRHVVDVDLTAHGVEEPHPVDDVGEQVDVVADHHQPTGVCPQELAQPAKRVGVEVVGGLVEQQRRRRTRPGVGCGEQDAGQLDAAALTAGQGAQRLGQNPFGQAEARADAAGLALGAVPAERREPLLELAVAAHGAVTGGVVGDLGHQRLLLLQIRQQSVEAARREHPVAGQHVEVALSGILWQITDFTGPRDVARVGLALAGQDAHGGGLARAVSADEPDTVAGLHPQGGSVRGQQRARACADLEVRCGDHAALLVTVTCRR